MTTSGSVYHKVIALISGGKDSFLSILQCQKQGHEVIALANLYPHTSGDSQEDDLNSHMYQTAGHSLIPFYEAVCNIPLYRRKIRYKTNQFGKEYDHSRLNPQDQDETEELTALLAKVLASHPDASAVCSGAILSTYQRTRIESVCLRLHLKPISYLWQMSFLPDLPETASIYSRSCALLDHIGDVRLDARIVKVASGGLDESYLWQSLLDPKVRHRIKTIMKKFGGSVIGEGGEFETLILSGPESLFKGEIIVPDYAIKTRTGEGGEAWLDIIDTSKVHVKLYQDDTAQTTNQTVTNFDFRTNNNIVEDIFGTLVWSPISGAHTSGFLLSINNLYDDTNSSSCKQQMQHIVGQIRDILAHENVEVEALVYTTIVLRHMEDFEAVNLVYGEQFRSPLPPARATIAVGNQMPHGMEVLVSCVVYRGDLNRKEGLHVQSISYWAPANIGPYSQAISVPLGSEIDAPRVVYIAGQIPLVPATMQPLESHGETVQEHFKAEAELALRHATRIGMEMKANWWSHAVAFVCSDKSMDAAERAIIAYDVWKKAHDRPSETLSDDEVEEEGPDAWDLKYGGQGSYFNIEEVDRSLPSTNGLRERSIPQFLAVQVEQLPRNQTIEWQIVALAGEHQGQEQSNEGIGNKTIFISSRMKSNTSSLETMMTIPCHRIWGLMDGEFQELESSITSGSIPGSSFRC